MMVEQFSTDPYLGFSLQYSTIFLAEQTVPSYAKL